MLASGLRAGGAAVDDSARPGALHTPRGRGLVLSAVGASLALGAVWTGEPSDELGKAVGTVTAFALASTQVSALAGRRQRRDPTSVRWLFALSFAVVAAVAAMYAALLWAQIERESYVRLPAAARARSSGRRPPADPRPCSTDRRHPRTPDRRRARGDRGDECRRSGFGSSRREGNPDARTQSPRPSARPA